MNSISPSALFRGLSILMLLLTACSTPERILRTAPITAMGANGELALVERLELVELSRQKQYILRFRRAGAPSTVDITGNYGKLPEAKRYQDMITVAVFLPGGGNAERNIGRWAGLELFTVHWIDPSLITGDEFLAIAEHYRTHRADYPELDRRVNALVRGSQRQFHEVFRTSRGWYLVTDSSGQIFITDNPSWEAKTLPPEQRRADFVARFDDTRRLHFREAKIIAGATKGFYGYDVLKIRIRKEGGGESTWEVDPRWGPVLYRDEAFGINRRLILDAVDSGGKRLGEMFRE